MRVLYRLSSLSSGRTRRLFTLISAWIKKISLISIRFRRCLKYWKLSQCSITAEHFPCPQMSSQTSLSPFLNVSDGMLSSYVTVCPRILQSPHLLRFSVAPIYMMFQFCSAFVITWYADFVNRINIIWCWTLFKVVLRGFWRNRCLSSSLKVSNS